MTEKPDVAESAPTVFVSYASQDAAIATAVVEALEKQGLHCWIAPRDVTPGQFYAGSIIHAIDAAKVLVLILSQNSASSPHVLREVERAASKRHAVISLKIDQSPLPADLEYFINTAQWLDASGDIKGAIPKLIAAVRIATQSPAIARATSPAPSAAAPPRSASRKAIVIASVLGIVVAALVTDRLWTGSRNPDHALPATASAPAAPSTTPPSPANSEKSVAVLPFVDMSENHDQEYFSDGLSEELIDLLAKTQGLHVIARTSSFSFKGKSDDIGMIAKTLRVANVLQGSVRKAGGHLRITAQLVRASDGEHLWSDSYDREVSDALKIQDEIAKAVVIALQMTLKKVQSSVPHLSLNTAAYNEYLRGRHFIASGTLDQYRRALDAFQKAVALDPQFGAAYAGIAISEFWIAAATGDPSGYVRAQVMAEKAVALSPDSADGYLARALLRRDLLWNWEGARSDVEKALELEPANASAYISYSNALLLTGGSRKDSLAAATKAVELDPLRNSGWQSLTDINILLGDVTAARLANQKGLDLSPDSVLGLRNLATLQMMSGNAADALVTARKIPDPVNSLILVAAAEHFLGHTQASRRTMDELTARFSVDCAYQIAEAHALRGETDDAFIWLDRAYRQRDGGLSQLTTDSHLTSIHGDARYKALVHKMNLPE